MKTDWYKNTKVDTIMLVKRSPFYIIGNWKSNKTPQQLQEWMSGFRDTWNTLKPDITKVTPILCPSFIHLAQCDWFIKQHQVPLSLGCQNISAFGSGAYTGEVSAQQVMGLVDYVIIGHSERRKYQHEEDSLLLEKIKQARGANLKVVYCIQSPDQMIPEGCDFVAYEPVWAIGTGKPETAAKVDDEARQIYGKAKREIAVIYGGSVTEENVSGYAQATHLDGVLPGGASLDPKRFVRLIANAAR